jgi:hypothetical protein
MRYLFVLFVFLFSCSNNETKTPEKSVNSRDLDTVSNEIFIESINRKKESLQSDQKEIHSKIEKKYGKQLDFCSCIQFHDSLNNAAQKELKDQQIEKLLDRWEKMEVRCKEIVNTSHRTPEERSEHEKKVKRCLTKR